MNYSNDGRKIFAKRVSFRENVYIRQWNTDNNDDDVNVNIRAFSPTLNFSLLYFAGKSIGPLTKTQKCHRYPEGDKTCGMETGRVKIRLGDLVSAHGSEFTFAKL